MGLALDEPEEGLRNFVSNGIEVFMHPTLAEQLQPFGGIVIDYVDQGPDHRGFTIGMKNKPTGVDCGGCPSGQTCDSETDEDSAKS